jgi:flagellar protein FliO/FliZ
VTRLAAIVGNRTTVASAAIVCVVAAFAGGELAGGAIRAMAVVVLTGCAAFALRLRRDRGAASAALVISERHAVAREVGVALVVVEGRRLVVGYAPAGVSLVTELAPDPRGGARP